jgi:nicotinic acid mononucleotide adenylyltransferase
VIQLQGSSDVSSTKVRDFITNGEYEEARRLVYPVVADYIEENKLYRK